jgi:hypothetical protein
LLVAHPLADPDSIRVLKELLPAALSVPAAVHASTGSQIVMTWGAD